MRQRVIRHKKGGIMEEKIQKTIKQYNMIESGDKIVLGVSGGPDSICMLEILNKLKNELKFDIVVAHVNHMIREEAEEDEKYVLEFCKNRKIECYTKKIDVLELSKMEKISTEEAGRKARYKFFEEILKITNSNKIATAHTANDNAETVLMNIIRGSGMSGLKGIEEKRDVYIRPLIYTLREEIEKFCEENSLNPRIDKTNMENIYTRNKIRNLLIPFIQKEFNPNIIDGINRLSAIAKQENEYLEKVTEKAFLTLYINEESNKEQIALELKKFNSLELVIKNRIVLYTINKLLRKCPRDRTNPYKGYYKIVQ